MGGDWLDCGEDRLHGGDAERLGATGGTRSRSAAQPDERGTGADQDAGAGEPRAAPGERDPAQGIGVFCPGGARPPTQAMIAFIDDHRVAYGVEPMCRVLPIAPSTYHGHAAKRADPTRLPARAKRDDALKPKIQRVFEENFRVYCVRKVWRQ